jgi:uncharacterized protein YegL
MAGVLTSTDLSETCTKRNITMPANRVTSHSPWHVVLLIDDSGSMSGPPAGAVNDALKHLISEMEMASQGKKPYFKVSIIAFGSSPKVIAEAAPETQIDIDAIATFKGDLGGTDAAAAFSEASALLTRNGGTSSDFTPFVFFFSDGAPNSQADAKREAEALKKLDIPAGSPWVISVGFGDAVVESFMRDVASTTELYRHLRTPSDIISFLPAIGTVAQSSAGGAEGVAEGVMNF